MINIICLKDIQIGDTIIPGNDQNECISKEFEVVDICLEKERIYTVPGEWCEFDCFLDNQCSVVRLQQISCIYDIDGSLL